MVTGKILNLQTEMEKFPKLKQNGNVKIQRNN